MRSATSVALLALLASPAFAAPLAGLEGAPSTVKAVARASANGPSNNARAAPVEEPEPAPAPATEEPEESGPSLGAQLGQAAAGGAAGAAVSNILNKIESLFQKRDLSDLPSILASVPDLSDDDKTTVKNALMNKIGSLQGVPRTSKRSPPVKPAAITAAAAQANKASLQTAQHQQQTDLATALANAIKNAGANIKDAAGAKRGLAGSLGKAAAGGAATGALGNILSEIESLFKKRDISSLPDILSAVPSLSDDDKQTVKTALVNKISSLQSTSSSSSKRDLSALNSIMAAVPSLSDADKQTVKSALVNKISTLQSTSTSSKRDLSALNSIAAAIPSLSDADKSTVKTALMNKISTLDSSSSKRGIATSALGGLTSLGTNTVVGDLLDKIESLFKREETMNKLASMQRRSPLGTTAAKPAAAKPASSGTGTAILGSAVGGAASAVVGNLLNEIESLFRRDDFEARAETLVAPGPAPHVIPPAHTPVKGGARRDDSLLAERSPLGTSSAGKTSSGTGTALLGSAVGGAASAAVGNILNEIESLFRRDDTIQVAPGIAKGPAETTAESILDKLESFFRRDEFELAERSPLGTTAAKPAAAKPASSSGGTGTALLGSAVGGAASAAVGNLLNEIESLFRRDDALLAERSPLSLGKTSSSSSGGTGTALLGSAVGGAASAAVGNILNEIESLFRRDEDAHLAARSPLSLGKSSSSSSGGTGTALLGSAVGGAASAAVGNILNEIESLFRRSDVDFELAERSPLSLGKSSSSSSGGTGTALLGSAVGGAASAAVGNILNEIESLFRRDDSSILLAERSPLGTTAAKTSSGTGTALLGSAVGGAASAAVGNILNEIESLFRRSDEFSINELD